MGDLKLPDSGSKDFKGSDGVSLSVDVLRELVKWAQLSLEGTQRFTLRVDPGSIALWSAKNELISKSIDYNGQGYKADFPIKVFASLVHNLPDADLKFEWDDSKYPGLVGFRTTSDRVNSIHLTRTMKDK
jgi:hypothetical protein